MSDKPAFWRLETLTMPEPWEGERVRSALNEQGHRFVSMTDMCGILGVKDVQTQIDIIRAAMAMVTAAGYEVDPAAMEMIELSPREDAKPRARSQPQACLREDELGWWAIHIKPAFLNDKSRANVGLIRHAVKLAATRGIFTGPPMVVPSSKLLTPQYDARGDVCCPWCHRYMRVTMHGETSTAEKVIDL